MKTFRSKLLLGVAAALGLSATAANAAITVSSTAGPDSGPPAGFMTVLDYDGISGYFTEGGTLNIGIAPGIPGVAAPPAGDTTNFGYIEQGQTYTLSAPLIKGFSLYLGSIDGFNEISFLSGGSVLQTFGGDMLAPPANGNQDSGLTNRRITFNFGGAAVDQVRFHSYGESMEWDTIAVPSAVPEPATWAMLITGFGLMGAMLRRRRLTAAAA